MSEFSIQKRLENAVKCDYTKIEVKEYLLSQVELKFFKYNGDECSFTEQDRSYMFECRTLDGEIDILQVKKVELFDLDYGSNYAPKVKIHYNPRITEEEYKELERKFRIESNDEIFECTFCKHEKCNCVGSSIETLPSHDLDN